MANEELIQRGYINSGSVRGDNFGNFEMLSLGTTTASEIKNVGLITSIPSEITFPFKQYKTPKRTTSSKLDVVYFKRVGSTLEVVAVKEMKAPAEFNNDKKRLSATEQGLFTGAVVGARVAIISDGTTFIYVDIPKSLNDQQMVYVDEKRDLNPGVLEDLITGGPGEARDPGPLAEKVWQAIWHATKEEPKQCLMTFVEIFILKFLSDNLSKKVLPESFRFYELTSYDVDAFQAKYGKTQIEYYVSIIRPKIKTIFPDNTIVNDQELSGLFGLSTIVSKTSIINGFAFLHSGETTLKTFNRTFVDILGYFKDFGVLTHIDPEFKLRLYESFLKKSIRQAKLGQFFTPRNIVRSMVEMAQLGKLNPGSLVLDPAAGVGGFLLEPLLETNSLANNIQFVSGIAKQNIRLVGVDVDINTNILAKANTLLHLAELVRDPNVSVPGLNQLLADMFHVININQHLGSLEYPIRERADVILTNPPYVTRGSGIYKEEILSVSGTRNGLVLKDYYDRTGLGLESLFLRYISGALKPGGRAFVIVPQGLLTRTEKSTKEKLLSECNLLASISLPRNTFFNTPQKTFILVLEKRRTDNDLRPNVFCALVDSIGETLDARRVPTPTDNTLNDVAKAFIEHVNGNEISEKRVRIIPSTSFSSSDRWDVQRFWNDEELVGLGARDEAVERNSFIEVATEQLVQIIEDFQVVKAELAEISAGETKEISLADQTLFKVRRGKRVIRKDGDLHPGNIPVYSGSKDSKRPLCSVDEEWAKDQDLPIEELPIVTINANGYVGACFVRNERCIIHDDVMIIEVINEKIDLDYLAQELRASIAAGNFEYEAKLYNRVKELVINIPFENGEFNISKQSAKADVVKRFDSLRMTLAELGNWSDEARILD